MSLYVPSETDALALQVPCAFCGASAGDWCHVIAHGAPTNFLHQSRVKPINRAWSAGYRAAS